MTDTNMQTTDSIDSNESLAHILHKEDMMRGYVLGERVMALCGYTFVPCRDPETVPLCEECREALQRVFYDALGDDD